MTGLRLLLVGAMLLLFSGAMTAGDEGELEVSHRIGGTVQSWFSFQQGDSVSNAGFGIRRARVRYYGAVNKKIKVFAQADLVSNGLAGKMLDARVEYHFNPQFNVRMGRFVGVGPRGGGQTLHSMIDIVERAYSAIRWASNTVGADYRVFGFQAEAKNDIGIARINVHNGTGDLNVLNRAGGTSTVERTPKAIAGQLIFKPKTVKGLEAGGHFDQGNDQVKDWSSYSAYAYFEPGPYRVKAEVIGVTNKAEGLEDRSSLGFYGFAAYAVTPHIEVLGRFEQYDPNTDGDDDGITFITLGAAYWEKLGKLNHKLTAAVVLPSEQGTSVDNTTVYAMWQFLW